MRKRLGKQVKIHGEEHGVPLVVNTIEHLCFTIPRLQKVSEAKEQGSEWKWSHLQKNSHKSRF